MRPWLRGPTGAAWPLLVRRGVVVIHASQNAIADGAPARRPAVIVSQPRPFDEQATTARTVDAAGLAVVGPLACWNVGRHTRTSGPDGR